MKKLSYYIWPFIQIGYACILLYLIVTDTLKFYLHPRLFFLSYVSVIALIVLGLECMHHNLTSFNKVGWKKGYIAFLLPALMIFVPTSSGDALNVASSNGLLIYDTKARVQTGQDLEVENDTPLDAPDVFEGEASTETDEKTEASASDQVLEDTSTQEHKTMEAVESVALSVEEIQSLLLNHEGPAPFFVDNERYLAFIDHMHESLNTFVGAEFQYVGIVYKQEDFADNEMVVGRMLMYCCAADTQIAGLLTKTREASKYKNGDWVLVSGRLVKEKYDIPGADYSIDLPCLEVLTVEGTDAPSDPYVYYE